MLEVMVGLFIFAFAAMGALASLLYSHRVQKQNEVRSVAVSLARQQLESLLAKSPQNRPAVTDRAFAISDEMKSQFPNGAEGIDLNGRYTVTDVGQIQQVSVQIRWRLMTSSGLKSKAPWSEVNLTSFTGGN